MKPSKSRFSMASRAGRAGSHRFGRCIAFIAAIVVGACASTQLDAQWVDPNVQPNLLRGAPTLVVCDAADAVVRQICQDQLAGEVVARGGSPVFAAQNIEIASDRPIDAQLLPAARGAGARALMVVTIAPAVTDVSPGFSVGIGGFGFGGGRSGVGVGVAAPIGGGRVTTGYSANARVTDVADGRLVWTARSTAPPSSDLSAQLAELSKSVMAAADKSGLF